jgi:hypothetical protein
MADKELTKEETKIIIRELYYLYSEDLSLKEYESDTLLELLRKFFRWGLNG